MKVKTKPVGNGNNITSVIGKGATKDGKTVTL